MLLALSHCALCKYKQAFVQLQLTFCTPCTICTLNKIVASTLVFWILPNCNNSPHYTFPSARYATFYEICENLCTIGQHVSVLYQVELVLGLHNSCSVRSDKIIIKCTKFVKLTKKFEDLGTIALPCLSTA